MNFPLLARSLVLASALLSSLTVQAQNPVLQETRAVLPSVRAGVAGTAPGSFAIGLLRVQDNDFRLDASITDYVTVSTKVTPDPAHVGQTADLITVVAVGSSLFVIDAEQTPVPWNGRIDSLVPRHANVTLKDSGEYTLYAGKIPVVGDLRFFVGYRLASNGALYYTATAQRFTINDIPAPAGYCQAYGGRTVPVWHKSVEALFTHAPFRAQDLSLITNGDETNDPRFSYQWVK